MREIPEALNEWSIYSRFDLNYTTVYRVETYAKTAPLKAHTSDLLISMFQFVNTLQEEIIAVLWRTVTEVSNFYNGVVQSGTQGPLPYLAVFSCTVKNWNWFGYVFVNKMFRWF